MHKVMSSNTSRLYLIVETAIMNMPSPADANTELRPTEIARMREMLSQTWDAVRDWLASHPSKSDRSAAAMHQGQFLTTALHMVCKLTDPPVDIVEMLIECSAETVTWQDSNGWLPLHHACANGASGKVLSVLVEAYPEGKIRQDKRFRTPLHFAFFRKDNTSDSGANGKMSGGGDNGGAGGGSDDDDDDDVGNSMPEIVRLLSDSGAAELQDEGGMVSVATGIHAMFGVQSLNLRKDGILLTTSFSSPTVTDALRKCLRNNTRGTRSPPRELPRQHHQKGKQGP